MYVFYYMYKTYIYSHNDLYNILPNRNIQLNLKNRLVKVDYKKSIAYFETDDGLKEYSVSYAKIVDENIVINHES